MSGEQMSKSAAYSCIYVIVISWVLFMIYNVATTFKSLKDKIQSIMNKNKVTPTLNITTNSHEAYQKPLEKIK